MKQSGDVIVKSNKTGQQDCRNAIHPQKSRKEQNPLQQEFSGYDHSINNYS